MCSLLSLDHIVIANKDLQATSGTYGGKFQIKTVTGGEHENWVHITIWHTFQPLLYRMVRGQGLAGRSSF